MQIEEIAIKELKPYDRNAKLHDDKQIGNVMESIKQFGFAQPLVVDKDNVVIIGHCRLIAAKRLKMEKVPVLRMADLNDEQVQKLRLLDNKLNESEWDMDLLAEDIPALDFSDFDLDWGLPELEEEIEIVEDEVPELPEEPKSKIGDLYQLGNHRLLCGDSTDINVIDKLMGGIKADMVFTDPPWNVNYGDVKQNNAMGYKPRKILNDSMTTEKFKDFMSETFAAMNHATKEGAMAYVVMSAQEWGNLMLSLFENNWHWSSTIIWNKDHAVLSRKDYHTKYEPIWYGWKNDAPRIHPLKDRKQNDVWDFERPVKSDLHPTMKPVALVAKAVQNSSNKENAVLDLFGGSGSTLIACEQLGRKCYMCELDPKYVDVIIERWEKFTGEKAVLL